MKHKLFGLAAAAAVGLTLLTGCPAEEKKETTTTTTTTETSAAPSAAASGETTTTTTTTTGSPAATASAEAGASAAPSAAASAGTTGAASAAPANKMAAAGNVDAKAIFAQKCSPCHGATGGGGMGPNLTNVEAKGDAFIKNRIENGSPAKGMPPFKGQLKPEEIDALVAYVKSL